MTVFVRHNTKELI